MLGGINNSQCKVQELSNYQNINKTSDSAIFKRRKDEDYAFMVIFLNYRRWERGFIAHLVEHRTGIAEVTGSNPVEALIFSGFFFPIA